MSFPNPPGYYSLQMPESVEIEIKELGYFELTETLNDITYAITPQGDDPAFEYLSSEADAYFALLVIEDRIALIRWLAEVLSAIANKRTALKLMEDAK